MKDLVTTLGNKRFLRIYNKMEHLEMNRIHNIFEEYLEQIYKKIRFFSAVIDNMIIKIYNIKDSRYFIHYVGEKHLIIR